MTDKKDDTQKVSGDGGTPVKGAPTGTTAVKVDQPGPGPGQPISGVSPAPNEGIRAGHEPQPPASKEEVKAVSSPAPAGPPKSPPPKNPGFVTCTVDGREVIAKPGTNMIEAAKSVGVEIPYYCYHPRLSIAANCRMCLVETSNAPKLVPACQTALAEGQAIKTQTSKVKDNQKAVLEFLLLNHPVDCAICDQAGECKLQDYYMRYDHEPSRLEGSKVLKAKRKVLGPMVVLDQERCILCTRCVRFMNEVPQEPQLGVFGRGSHERIDVFPGAELDSNYSGNTVDICPVGALLNRDYRFRARSWFLSAAPSVCTGCSRGCNTFADFMGQDTFRYRPRENEAINKSWMCDQGRLSYKYLNKERALVATLGRGADLREATGPEAVALAARELKRFSGEALAVMASPVCSNEDLLASLTFARDVLGTKAVYVSGRPMGAADHYLMTADKNPNRKGLEWIAASLGLTLRPFEGLAKALDTGSVRALYGIGGEIPVEAAGFAGSAEKLELFVLQAFNVGPLTEKAHVLLPASPHLEDEGSFVQQDGIVQRFRKAYPPRGDSLPHWKWAGELSTAMGVAVTPASARELWRSLSPSVPELNGFDWDGSAPPVQRKPGINPLPTGADGRPPGYREFGAPRVRGI